MPTWIVAHHPHVTYEGPAAWEALIVLATVGLSVVTLLAVLGRLELSSGRDLVNPVAITATVAALATIPLRTTVGGAMPWALPLGAALLLGLFATAISGADRLGLPALGGVVAAGLAGLLVVSPQLERRPAAVATPHPAEDASLLFVDLEDGDEISSGSHTVTVEVVDATIGPPDIDPEDLPEDVDELGHVLLASISTTEGRRLAAPTDDVRCTNEDPCERVSFDVRLPAGTWELEARFLAADHLGFEPPVTTTATVTVR